MLYIMFYDDLNVAIPSAAHILFLSKVQALTNVLSTFLRKLAQNETNVYCYFKYIDCFIADIHIQILFHCQKP